MTGTVLYVNKPHCTAAARCGLFTHTSVPVIFEPPCIIRVSIFGRKFMEHKMCVSLQVLSVTLSF